MFWTDETAVTCDADSGNAAGTKAPAAAIDFAPDPGVTDVTITLRVRSDSTTNDNDLRMTYVNDSEWAPGWYPPSGKLIQYPAPALAPNAPTALMFSNVTGRSFKVSWRAAFNAATYRVFVDGVQHTTASTTLTVTGKIPGSTHSVRVVSVGPGGVSTSSTTRTVRLSRVSPRIAMVLPTTVHRRYLYRWIFTASNGIGRTSGRWTLKTDGVKRAIKTGSRVVFRRGFRTTGKHTLTIVFSGNAETTSKVIRKRITVVR